MHGVLRSFQESLVKGLHLYKIHTYVVWPQSLCPRPSPSQLFPSSALLGLQLEGDVAWFLHGHHYCNGTCNSMMVIRCDHFEPHVSHSLRTSIPRRRSVLARDPSSKSSLADLTFIQTSTVYASTRYHHTHTLHEHMHIRMSLVVTLYSLYPLPCIWRCVWMLWGGSEQILDQKHHSLTAMARTKSGRYRTEGMHTPHGIPSTQCTATDNGFFSW